MKKISLSVIINTVISATLIFIVFLALISFLKTKTWIKILLAAIFSLLSSTLIFLLDQNRSARRRKEKLSREFLKSGSTFLSTLNKKQIFSLTEKLLTALNVDYVANENFLTLNGVILCPLLFLEELSFNDVKRIVDSCCNEGKLTVIISDSFSKKAIEYEKAINALYFKTEDFFTALKTYDLLPDFQKPPLKKDNFFAKLFKKVNGVKFIAYGICLLLLSFVVFYPTYYIISGSIFTFFGIFAIIFGKRQPDKNRKPCDLIEILTKPVVLKT